MADQPTTAQTVAGQAEGLAAQAVSGLKALSPADKSWVAAFVLIVLIIVGADTWSGMHQYEQATQTSARLTAYLTEVEKNRSDALDRQTQFFDDQMRRSQEVIRDLADVIARDSERYSLATINAAERRVEDTRDLLPADFIGPPMAGDQR